MPMIDATKNAPAFCAGARSPRPHVVARSSLTTLVCGLLVSAVTIGTGGSANGPAPWIGRTRVPRPYTRSMAQVPRSW